MQQDSTQALANTAVSITAASLTITQVQPLITMIAGLVAIISGLLAIIYYVKQKGKYTGVNKTICSNLSVWFNSEGVNKATFRNKPESIVYPLIEIDDKEMRIKNFVWLENKRPKNKADLLLGKK